MKKKFELKCNKIKGIAFHRSRQNWAAIALFTGEVQVWDFRNGFKVAEFKDSEICVRSIDFHPLQCLIAAGGDDFIIRGYDFSENKKSFELKGHVDFVRTVQFHHELPWVLSCSDDQTLRVWNWQSKTQLSVITGHSHYVMCARFHPTKDLIASGSLDSNLRLWDYSKLKSRFSSSHGTVYMLSNDVEATVIVETHNKGVNWIEFHPTEDLVATCSDDKLIKVWRFTVSGAYEESSFHGHTNNVSAIAFTPDGKHLISNSEDFTVRLWDLKSNACLQKFVISEERQWAIAVHSELPLVASGGDKSLVILSLNSERVRFDTTKFGVLVFFSPREAQLKAFILATGATMTLTPTGSSGRRQGEGAERRTASALQLNPFAQGTAVSGTVKIMVAGELVLHIFSGVLSETFTITPVKAKQAVFLSADKVLTLGDDSKLRLVKLQGLSLVNDFDIPFDIDDLFQGSAGKAFLKSGNKLIAWDFIAKRELFTLEDEDFNAIRRVLWSPSKSHFAIITKFTVHIYDKLGRKRCSRKEDSKVKSALWAPDNVLFYNTHEHIKFVLKDGEMGLVRSIDKIMFLAFFQDRKLITFDGNENFEEIELDTTEIEFKNSFLKKGASETAMLLKERSFLGKSMVSYLLNKKFNSVALQLTQDKETAFYLALYSKNFAKALEIGKELGKEALFELLGEECLAYGIDDLAEECWRLAGNTQKLVMLCSLNGRTEKVGEVEGAGAIFNKAVLTGDVEERIRVLSESGQVYLAYVTAVAYGYREHADRIEQAYPDVKTKVKLPVTALAPVALKPLTPATRTNRNLLLNTVDLDDVKAAVEDLSDEETDDGGKPQLVTLGQAPVTEAKVDFSKIDKKKHRPSEDKVDFKTAEIDTKFNINAEEAADAWGVGDEDILDNIAPEEPQKATAEQQQTSASRTDTFYKEEHPFVAKVKRQSSVAAELFAVGEVQAGLNLLQHQIGLKDPKPLKKYILELSAFNSVYSSFGVAGNTILSVPLTGKGDKVHIRYTFETLKERIDNILSLVTKAKIQEAVDLLNSANLLTLFLRPETLPEAEQIQSIKDKILQYSICLRAKLLSDKTTDPVRKVELLLAMSSCAIEPAHRLLILQLAINALVKLENFVHALVLVRKFLRLSQEHPGLTKEDSIQKMKRLEAVCEQKGKNTHDFPFREKYLYEDNIASRIAYNSLTFMFPETVPDAQVVHCSFDRSAYPVAEKGGLCAFCSACEIGYDAVQYSVVGAFQRASGK